MTAPGPAPVHTPIAGLVELALSAPAFTEIIERAGDPPAELALVGPVAARPFVAAALARQTPLLVATATGHEADDLTAELRGVYGDTVALFPSWETLPHERLSPGSTPSAPDCCCCAGWPGPTTPGWDRRCGWW